MAVTVSFDKCLACKENNATSANVCRKCKADLPWSKQYKAMQKSAAKASAAKAAATSASASGVQTAPMKASLNLPQIDGMLVFMWFVAFCMPLIGYFAWRSYAADDHEYSDSIRVAWILGLASHALRLFA